VQHAVGMAKERSLQKGLAIPLAQAVQGEGSDGKAQLRRSSRACPRE